MILFDGVCHLCNGFVQFILRRDPAGRFDFAPLQSDYARDLLDGANADSVALIEGGRVYRAEEAVLRILAKLKLPWPAIARIVGLLPKPMLGWGYRTIARNRYRWFGREETCMLPRPEWKGRFLA